MQPWIEVIIISFFVSVFSRVIQSLMTDYNKSKELKEEIKELRAKMKGMEVGSKEQMKLNEKVINMNFKMTKMQLKPSMVTLIPLVFVLMWMRGRYADMGAFVILPFSLPLIKNDIGWLLTYFLSVTVFNMIFKKVETLWRERK